MTEETLEDQAFGPLDAPCAAGEKTWSDNAADYMLPVITTVVMILMLSWSTCKEIEYHELIHSEARYRNTVVAMNAAVVLIGVVVVAWAITTHRRT